MKHSRLIAVTVLAFLVGGCQYYQVTDPSSGRRYVTHDLIADKYKLNGALDFDDLCTNQEVVLQSSEVKAIPEVEAKADIAEGSAFTTDESK